MIGEYLAAIKRGLSPSDGVRGRTATGGVWVVMINAADKLLQMGKLIVLASLIAPDAFGLLGIALLVLVVLRQATEFGFDVALIQQREEDVDAYLNTAWTMRILQGVALGAIAYAAAPLIASFFSEPRVTPLLRVLALSPLIVGLRNPAAVYFKKNLEFHKQFVYRITGSVFDVVVAIAFGLVFGSVWALIVGKLAGDTTRTLVSYAIDDHRPWPEFEREFAVEMFGYGKWVLGSGMVIIALNRGDDAFLGWFLGATALGFYQLAYQFSNAPATEISHVISKVTFPAYSKVQDDVATLRNGFFTTVQLTSLVAIPASVGILVVTPTFVEAFFRPQYYPMIPVMQMLAVYGLLRSVGTLVGPLFNAIGRPDIEMKLAASKLVLVAVAIYPATDRWGVVGTAIAIIFGSLVANPLGTYVAVRKVEGSLREYLGLLAYPTLGSAAMGLAVVGLERAVEIDPLFEFPLLVAVGVATYGLVMLLLERRIGFGLEDLLGRLVAGIQDT